MPVRLMDAGTVTADGLAFRLALPPWSRLPWHPALDITVLPDQPRRLNRLNAVVQFSAPSQLPVRLNVPVVPLILVAAARYAWYSLRADVAPVTNAAGTAWQTHGRSVAGLLGRLQFDRRHLGYLGQAAMLECYHPSGSLDMRAWVQVQASDLPAVLQDDADLAWHGLRDRDGNTLMFG